MLNFKGLKKMKKLFVIFAVATMIVACQKPAATTTPATDSTKVDTMQVDTAKVDTATVK